MRELEQAAGKRVKNGRSHAHAQWTSMSEVWVMCCSQARCTIKDDGGTETRPNLHREEPQQAAFYASEV